jgi:hypothetical protein
MNIHLINFNDDDFISKNAKARIKKLIKDSISLNDQTKFNELKSEIITRCLKSDANYNILLKYTIDDNNFKLIIEKEDIKQDLKEKEELLRKKLKNIILNSNSDTIQKNMSKQEIHQEEQIKKEISDDVRITINMVKAYNKAIITFGVKIPNPIEIINDKDKHVNEIFQHILTLSRECSTKEKLFEHLDNDYINYIQLVCDFNYKQYIDQFFKKVNDMTDNTSDIPEIVKSNQTTIIKEKDLNSNIQEALNESDDDIEDVHSDEES